MNGFTLVELMISIVIFAILTAIALPAFKSIVANTRIKTVSFDLYSGLTFARSEAIKRNTSIALRAGATTDGAWTTGWRVVDPSNTVLRSWGAVSNLTITELQSSATTVTYGKDGRLTTTTFPKFQIDASGSAITKRCIQVSLSGRPTTQTGACS